jgi:peptide/nickel transport system substrate-binding protein
MSTVTMDLTVMPSSLDPVSIKDSASEIVDTQIYEELFYYNFTTQTISPWLASGYNVSSNGMQYNISLRQGINFADGTPFNATAVKFSIDRQVIMSTGVTGYYEGVLNGAKTYSLSNKTAADVTAFEAAGGVKILGPYEVQFNLEIPAPSFLLILSMVYLSAMVSPTFVNSHGGVVPATPDSYMNTNMGAGTGPYTGTYDVSSGSMVLTANPHYWGSPYNAGVAKIHTLVFNVVTDDLKQVLDLKSGQANVIQFDSTNLFNVANQSVYTSSNGTKLVSATPNVSVIGPYGTLSFFAIMLNQHIKNPDGSEAKVQPFQNKDVRLALQYAFDQQTYIRTLLNGIGLPMFGVIPSGMLGYKPGFPTPFPYDLNMSKALLENASKELGFSPSNPLTVTAVYPSGETGSENMITLLASAINGLNTGFIIAVTPQSNPQYLSQLFSGTLQMGRILWGGDFADPDGNLQAFGNGITGVLPPLLGANDTALNAVLIKERSETNATARLQLIEQANQMLAQDAWYLWGAQLSNIYGVSSTIQSFQVSGETTAPLFYFAVTT